MDVERREFGDAVVRHVGSDDRLSEAQHRIANNLALIAGYTRLQATRLNKAGQPLSAREVCIALEEVAARIETVGELHRLLSAAPGQSEADIDLGQFLAKLCASLMQTVSFAGDTAITHDDAGGCLVRPDQATPVALIVSELVTNALKYAHPAGVTGRIKVSCRPLGLGLGAGLVVEVTDDGVGLSEDFDPLTDGGLGFRVVRGLARQLGATLNYESTGLGLTVRLTLAAEDEHRVVPFWREQGRGGEPAPR
jgi:two-component sensor histidine kinase